MEEGNNIDFRELSSPPKPMPKSSGLSGWLIKHSGGFIKNDNRAIVVMLIISVIELIVAVGIIFWVLS